jgi:retron-type reverse transcriptase
VKKFFPSVPRVRIFKFFSETLQCRRDVAGLLAQVLTYEEHLPTGSSASPIIAYYAFKLMFDEIQAFAIRNDLTMTCYVDDMTLSGANATPSLLFDLHKIVRRYGLKSHKMRYLAPKQPKVITGVCNTVDGRRVPNKLHLKIKEGFDSLAAAVTKEAKLSAIKPLLGRLEAAGQIDPKFHQRARTLRRKSAT